MPRTRCRPCTLTGPDGAGGVLRGSMGNSPAASLTSDRTDTIYGTPTIDN